MSYSEFPRLGPDPAHPFQPFEDGSNWFQLECYPARLATRPFWFLPLRGLLGDLLLAIWESAGGAIALRIDNRFKVLVRRKKAGIWDGYRVVAVELYGSEAEARARCVEILKDWRTDNRFMTAEPMSRREVAAAIR